MSALRRAESSETTTSSRLLQLQLSDKRTWQSIQSCCRGVNLPLAFTGQEYVWKQLYMKYGLQEADLAPYFSGPAFLPWQRMGNMRGVRKGPQ